MAFPAVARLRELLHGREALAIALAFTVAYSLTADQYASTYDQLRNLIVSRGVLDYGIPAFEETAYWQHPPLFHYLVAGASYATGGDLHLAAIGVVLLFAGLSIYCFYRLAERIGGKGTGFAWKATMFFGALPMVWEFANRDMHETMILFFFTAVPLAWLKYRETRKLGDAALAGALLGLGLLAKTTMVLLYPILVAMQVLLEAENKKWTDAVFSSAMPLAVAFFVALAVFSPYAYYRAVNGAPSLESFIAPIFSGGYDWDPKMPALWYLYNIGASVTLPIALLAVAGAYAATGRKESSGLASALWLWAIGVLVFMSAGAHKEPRFLMPLVPAMVLLATLGLEWAGGRPKLGRVGQIAGTVAVAGFLAAGSLSVVLYDGSWPSQYGMWKEIAALDSNALMVGNIPTGYVSVALFSGKTGLMAGQDERDLAAAVAYNSRYALYPDSYGPKQMARLKSFPECNCSLYRIDESVFAGMDAIRITDREGKPVVGAFAGFDDGQGLGELGFSNATGHVLLQKRTGQQRLWAQALCYSNFYMQVDASQIQALEVQRMPNCFAHRMQISRI